MKSWALNTKLKVRLLIVSLAMFGFGYALVPLYKAMCSYLGINVLAIGDNKIGGVGESRPLNTQIDKSRTITVEFDTNVRGLWYFKPGVRSIQVHPGEMATVMYEFQNLQSRRISAQAIPSYAPLQAGPHFNKIECFCFQEYTLDPGERKSWPVVFIVDPKLSDDVKTITLSYTFFEVGGRVPPAPQSNISELKNEVLVGLKS